MTNLVIISSTQFTNGHVIHVGGLNAFRHHKNMETPGEGECSNVSFEMPSGSRNSSQNPMHSTPQNKTPLSSKASVILRKCSLIAPRPENDENDSGDENEGEWKFWNQVLKVRDVMLEHMDGEDFLFGRKDISKFNKLAREKHEDLVSAC